MPAAVVQLHEEDHGRRYPRVRIEPHDVVMIVGKRGTGKSTAAKRIIRRAMRLGQPVVAFDPHDEYSRLGRDTGQVTLGPLTSRVTMAQLAAHPELLATEDALAVVPDSREPEPMAEDFRELAGMVMAQGDVVLVVDEIGSFKKYLRDSLDWLATQSRHESVPLVLVSQRAAHITATARSQVTQLVSFRQDHPDDLDALADIAGRDFAEEVSRLPRGEWKHWRDADAYEAPQEEDA